MKKITQTQPFNWDLYKLFNNDGKYRIVTLNGSLVSSIYCFQNVESQFILVGICEGDLYVWNYEGEVIRGEHKERNLQIEYDCFVEEFWVNIYENVNEDKKQRRFISIQIWSSKKEAEEAGKQFCNSFSGKKYITSIDLNTFNPTNIDPYIFDEN
jgi:hypothetical protein